MRIISGSARGRPLQAPPARDRLIRPTSDMAREALFNIIGPRVRASRVLDLFAGTGAFGCEALSRGAAWVCFIDQAKLAVDLIDRNRSLVPDGRRRSRIIRHDLRRGLGAALFTDDAGPGFDLVFADPPYGSGLAEAVVTELDKKPVLSPDPLLIIEERKTFNAPDQLMNLMMSKRRRYGDSVFIFWRRR